MVNSAAPYSFKEDFEATTFTVNPEPWDVGGTGSLVTLCVMSAGLLTMCASMTSGGSRSNQEVGTISFLVLLGFCALAVYGAYRRRAKDRTKNEIERRQVTLHVTDTDLRIGDGGPNQVVIPYQGLHQLVVRNALDGQYQGSTSRSFSGVIGTGVVGGVAMASTAALGAAANIEANLKLMRMKKWATVSFQVVAEANGVPYTLAQGMTETGANGLVSELSKAIQERRTQ